MWKCSIVNNNGERYIKPTYIRKEFKVIVINHHLLICALIVVFRVLFSEEVEQ